MPTKKELIGFVREKLSSDVRWATRGLLRLNERQTPEEKFLWRSIFANDIGFSGLDDRKFSYLVRLAEENRLTPQHEETLLRLMPKYASQIYELSDKEKLIKSYFEQEKTGKMHQPELELHCIEHKPKSEI